MSANCFQLSRIDWCIERVKIRTGETPSRPQHTETANYAKEGIKKKLKAVHILHAVPNDQRSNISINQAQHIVKP